MRIIKRKVSIQPRFNEIDIAGIVHNAVYFVWFELGRMQFMEELVGLERAMALNIVVPVVYNTCKYRSPVRFGDRLVLFTTHEIRDPYAGKLVFHHSLMHEDRKVEMASGESAVTILDRTTNQLVKEWPPDIWRKYLELK